MRRQVSRTVLKAGGWGQLHSPSQRRWYHKLTSFHLKRHGLTIPEYKELYGLNVGTALETPRITALLTADS